MFLAPRRVQRKKGWEDGGRGSKSDFILFIYFIFFNESAEMRWTPSRTGPGGSHEDAASVLPAHARGRRVLKVAANPRLHREI